jgi:tRNA-Thr(GGU) m(6)t(6)A37 methyltransferase TsaA
MPHNCSIEPIGIVRSELKDPQAAPLQGDEGAPDAWLEVDARVARALVGISVGTELMVLTWLHRAERDVLQVHPRGDTKRPLTGVFATRSPDRPNPVGLHRVKVLEVAGTRLRVAPLEAIDGTPLVDIKVALSATDR